MVTVSCPNEGCNEIHTRSQIDNHLQSCQYQGNQLIKRDIPSNHSVMPKVKSTAQKCQFAVMGCQFTGNDSELAIHMEKDMSSHLEYICKFLLNYNCSSHKTNGYTPNGISMQ